MHDFLKGFMTFCQVNLKNQADFRQGKFTPPRNKASSLKAHLC